MTSRTNLLEDKSLSSLESRVCLLEENFNLIQKALKVILRRLNEKRYNTPSVTPNKKKVRFSNEVMVIPYSSGYDTSSCVRETEECEFNEALCAPVEEPVAIIVAQIPEGHVES